MVCVILCPECCEDLGEVYLFYDLVKKYYIDEILEKNKLKIDVDKIDFKKDVLVNFEFIFEAIKINNTCCRMHILGSTNFDSLYF